MSDRQDSLEIRDVIENWAVWRDAGDWDRFQTVWGEDGYIYGGFGGGLSRLRPPVHAAR